jgi:glucose-1-phosphate adenylyltransferase
VYRMDPRQMVEQHLETGAGLTVSALRVPRAEASEFGVIRPAADGRTIDAFLEKPADPPGLPDSPDETLASMGNYVFTTKVLIEALHADADDPASLHDMGGSIVPMLVDRGMAGVYDFTENEVPGAKERDRGYWRDVGTIDAYYDAHLDLCTLDPVFNLYNPQWPILTSMPSLPPAKFVRHDEGRTGMAVDSIVSNGVIVSGGSVRRSVLSPGVRVNSWAEVTNSVVMNNAVIGRRAVVRNAILDKNVVVPPGAVLGVDKDHDRARGYTVSPDGITVVGKGRTIA